MNIYLYRGGSALVAKSGIGQAIAHQQDMLSRIGVHTTCSWAQPAEAVQLNTVFPDSVLTALRARLQGRRVVYYGHSTMEDFRNSFRGSNWLSPLFRRWICFCYGLGDVVLTPTEYSRSLLKSYGLRRPVYAISNGVDTRFFAPDPDAACRFRERWGLGPADRAVVSVGHLIGRKGLPEFIELARQMPQVRFFWFGWTDPALLPPQIVQAIRSAPENLCFPGYVSRGTLRDAYCGADAFVFMSHEETEGIVVLEALSCGTPALVRDIPVYQDWLRAGTDVYKADSLPSFRRTLEDMLSGRLPDLTAAGRAVAQRRSLDTVGARLRTIYEREGIAPAREHPHRMPAVGESRT